MTANAITVLRCRPKLIATKRWSVGPDGAPVCEGYGKAKNWHVGQHRVAGLEQLAGLLDRLAADPRAIVIRGEPLPGVLGTWGPRRQHVDPETGEAPRFEPAARRWVALDFDHVHVLRPFDLREAREAREAVTYLRGMLSAEFRAAACYAMLTSSAGFGPPDQVSARLWFWLSRPVSDAELSAWRETTKAPVDGALFRAVQAHYVAAPLFDGMADPIPRRSGMLDGSPEVALESYETPRPRPAPLPYVPRRSPDDRGDEVRRRYARGTLESLARELASAPEGDRHAKVHSAARRAGGLVPGRWLTRDEIFEELSSAARAAGLTGGRAEEVARTIADGIECGASRWPWDPDPALEGTAA